MHAGVGACMHFLPHDELTFAQVHNFDVDALAEQLQWMGARYLLLTLGQNSGWFNAPNATYEKYVGCRPGERCTLRDLPGELSNALADKGIRLLLYLPCQPPNRDANAQRAFDLPQGPKDQPLSQPCIGKWAEVIQEWSIRYGDRVGGWWFDGAYEHVQFTEATASIYAEAARRGNADAIVTFNPGVKLIRYTQAEDYTAGELVDPFEVLPTSRWVDGSQWHALTYLGSNWMKSDVRHCTATWRSWVAAATAQGGVVTLDVGSNQDPTLGPIGAVSAEQAQQFRDITHSAHSR